MMRLHFTEDEKADFLLARGYIICVRVEVYEENVYQNRFITRQRIVVEAVRDGETRELDSVFMEEMKNVFLLKSGQNNK